MEIAGKYRGEIEVTVYRNNLTGHYEAMNGFQGMGSAFSQGTKNVKKLVTFTGVNELGEQMIHRAVADLERGATSKQKIRKLLSE